MIGHEPLRARVQAGEHLLGGLLRMPNEALVELVGLVRLDFVVIDCEHGPADQLALQHHLLAAAAHDLEVLVRVGATSPAEILRVLDLGAAGIVVPHVDSAAAAAAAARAAHYPPLGDRGTATYTRAGRYGLTNTEEHLAAAADRTVVVIMIESRRGVDAADEIAAVGGVDAVFVGPGDLAVDLGHPGRPDHPDVVEATARVAAACGRRGRSTMVIVSDEGAASAAFSSSSSTAGAGMVVYNVQAALNGLFTRLAAARR